MSESLRAMLHPPAKRVRRGPVIVAMTPEQRDIAERYARRALGR